MTKLAAMIAGLLGMAEPTEAVRPPDINLPRQAAEQHAEGLPPIEDEPGYQFFWRNPQQNLKHQAEAAAISREILSPTLSDPNFLVLKRRRQLLTRWVSELTGEELRVLDIGGRIKPYEPLLEERLSFYVGLDPILEGLVDVVGVGEELPFADGSFDLVLCTQALNYAPQPGRIIAEANRVLAPGGWLFLTVPAIFPRYHDQMWRFMPAGLKALLSDYEQVEVVPDDRSIAGFARSVNLFVDTFVTSERAHGVARRLIYPSVNWLADHADRFSGDHTEFATNYSCRARKIRPGASDTGPFDSHHT